MRSEDNLRELAQSFAMTLSMESVLHDSSTESLESVTRLMDAEV